MKILIVRFSSFGDIIQALPCATSLHKQFPNVQIHWLVRSDFAELLKDHPHIQKVIVHQRREGLQGLVQLLASLKAEKYTHLYDAHNNLRSWVVRLWASLFWPSLQKSCVRSKNRWKRFLFFKLRRPVFTLPFRGAESFTEPLQAWGLSKQLPPPPHLFISSVISSTLPATYIALAPSAAWPTKRWPVEHWKSLIQLMPQFSFVVLGGPQDSFCADIQNAAPDRVLNLAGRCSLVESCEIVRRSLLTISNDTGLLHAADQLGTLNIGLIGPTAFGYTSQPQSHILETHLSCKPCSKDGRDPCTNPVFQKCLRDVTPETVARQATHLTKDLV